MNIKLILKATIISSFIFFITGSCALFAIIYLLSQELPDETKIVEYKPAIMSRIYSNNGEYIDQYADQSRLYVKYEDIPPMVINAFLSAEDQNYFTHNGVDLVRIFKAMIINIQNYVSGNKKTLIGASTITQQVIKNLLLTNERTFKRKIKEALLAIKVTKKVSKEKILELYLNEIFLGHQSYGVANASINYFSKPLEKLSLSQIATLAILPKAPSKTNPITNPRRAKFRRDWVLDRMYDEGYISDSQRKLAQSIPIIVTRRPANKDQNISFFSEAVKREIIKKFGEEAPYTNGYSIITTIDPKLQNHAVKTFQKHMIKYNKKYGYKGPIANVDVSLFSFTKTSTSQLTDFLKPYNNFNNFINNWVVSIVIANHEDYALIYNTQDQFAILPLKEMTWASGSKYINMDSRPGLKYYLKYFEDGISIVDDVVSEGDIILTERSDKSLSSYNISTDDFSLAYEHIQKIIPDYKPQKKFAAYKLHQEIKLNGGLIAMDPHTGKIKALVGGTSSKYGFGFNRAMQAKRQPGSALKPFIYLAALQSGIAPNDIFIDDEIRIALTKSDYWIPKNYNEKFLGPITVRKGLESSKNLITIKLAQKVGFRAISNTVKSFSIYDKFPYYYSSILGAKETTLLQMVNAYAMIANGGHKITPQFIEKIQNYQGKSIERQKEKKCLNCNLTNVELAKINNSTNITMNQYFANARANLNPDATINVTNVDNTQQKEEEGSENDCKNISVFGDSNCKLQLIYNDEIIDIPQFQDDKKSFLDPYATYQTLSLLEGVIQRGTGWRVRSALPNKVIGGKTGTTNEYNDAWFIGFSNSLVVGVYAGFDNPSSLGNYESGSSVTAPIFIDFMKEALRSVDNRPFPIPDGIKFIQIDKNTGQIPNEFTKIKDLINEAFKPGDKLPTKNTSQNNSKNNDEENISDIQMNDGLI